MLGVYFSDWESEVCFLSFRLFYSSHGFRVTFFFLFVSSIFFFFEEPQGAGSRRIHSRKQGNTQESREIYSIERHCQDGTEFKNLSSLGLENEEEHEQSSRCSSHMVVRSGCRLDGPPLERERVLDSQIPFERACGARGPVSRRGRRLQQR